MNKIKIKIFYFTANYKTKMRGHPLIVDMSQQSGGKIN